MTAHALGIARRIVGNLNRVKRAEPRHRRAARAALRSADDLYGIVPSDTRKPYDVREVIARLVDGSEFDEFKPLYGADPGHRLRAALGLSRRHRRQ